ncbi:MAG: hypothetical protein M3Q42_10490 [Pseudomonadota bacterium]|nr:hypothetical protein [Pseudomonadota bacterium]
MLGICLVGCASTRPLPLREPTDVNAGEYHGGGLSPASTPDEVKRNLKVYADAYLQHADALHSNSYSASDTAFSGGLLGMIGGLAKSPETAIAGALLSGGGNTAQARYQFQVQAANYEKAADALYCMRRHLYPYPGPIDVGMANDRIDTVRRKLRTAQSKVTLAATDVSALETALKKLIPIEEAATEQKEALAQAMMDLEKGKRTLELLKKRAAAAEKSARIAGDRADVADASQGARGETRDSPELIAQAQAAAVQSRQAAVEQQATVIGLQREVTSLAADKLLVDEIEAQLEACATQF